MLNKSIDLENLSASLQFLTTLPRSSLGFSDWIQNRLPEYGKSYRELLSRLERISLMLLEYLRTLIFLFLFIVVFRKLFDVEWFSGWGKLNSFIDENGNAVLILIVIVLFFLNKVIYEFKRSDY